MAEQGTHKPLVGGSNPPFATKKETPSQKGSLFCWKPQSLFDTTASASHLKMCDELRQPDLGHNELHGTVQRQVLA